MTRWVENEIADTMAICFREIERLIRTETTYMANAALMERLISPN